MEGLHRTCSRWSRRIFCTLERAVASLASGARRIPHFRVCGRVPATNSRGFLLCLHSSPAFERSVHELQSVAICGMGTNCRSAVLLAACINHFARPSPTDFQPSTAAEAAGALFVQVVLVPGLGLGLVIWGYCSRVREERACAVTADRLWNCTFSVPPNSYASCPRAQNFPRLASRGKSCATQQEIVFVAFFRDFFGRPQERGKLPIKQGSSE